MNALQELIQERMNKLGIESYSELGRRAGLSRSTVWALATTEQRTTMPKLDTMRRVATALFITEDELKLAAYESLRSSRPPYAPLPSALPYEDDDPVRVVGEDFELLPREDRNRITKMVRGEVQRRLDELNELLRLEEKVD